MYEQAGRGADVFQIRLPDGMRAEIKKLAAANLRSMNSEIVFRLARDMEREAAFAADVPEGRNGGGEMLAG